MSKAYGLWVAWNDQRSEICFQTKLETLLWQGFNNMYAGDRFLVRIIGVVMIPKDYSNWITYTRRLNALSLLRRPQDLMARKYTIEGLGAELRLKSRYRIEPQNVSPQNLTKFIWENMCQLFEKLIYSTHFNSVAHSFVFFKNEAIRWKACWPQAPPHRQFPSDSYKSQQSFPSKNTIIKDMYVIEQLLDYLLIVWSFLLTIAVPHDG